MKRNRFLPLLLAGALLIFPGEKAFADTEDEIAYMQEVKQEAETQLSQTWANISSLESAKQELEIYLDQLNAQYDELTECVARLGEQAAVKEDELKVLKKKLKRARQNRKKQYQAMKLRIVYLYENGQSTWLEQLLACEDLAQFLNQAENVMELTQYDRDMLKKYETLTKRISRQEKAADEEMKESNALMAERAAAQQEVKELAASTSESISSYISEISASQAEADALMAQVASADNSIAALMIQAEEERAALAEQQQEAQEQEGAEEDPGYDPETASADPGGSEAEEEEDAEEIDGGSEEELYGDSSGEESSSGSSRGTYLGTFTLTAYCNCAQCCGSAGNATASGTSRVAGRTVAMGGVPFGTQLLINGNVYTVEDLGTPYGHVDIFFDSHEAALNFGMQSAEVYRLN